MAKTTETRPDAAALPARARVDDNKPLIIDDPDEYKAYVIELLGGPEEYEAAGRVTITHEELHKMLSHDKSCWSDTVRQLRDEGY